MKTDHRLINERIAAHVDAWQDVILEQLGHVPGFAGPLIDLLAARSTRGPERDATPGAEPGVAEVMPQVTIDQKAT